jgi:PPM family protein phosphatase
MQNAVECSSAILTKVGGRKRNEDACGLAERNGFWCALVSDGAGGHGGGDVASRLAVDGLLASFKANPARGPEQLDALIRMANQTVIDHQSDAPALHDMRATIVILLVDADHSRAVWGHLGDSRLYLFRDGKLTFQTKDHSVFQAMVDAGFAKPGAARESSQRTMLTGSLGGHEGFTPVVTTQPQAILAGDAFLLCSDGFWEHVTEADMAALLRQSSSPDDWLTQMETTLLAARREGHDNYSAVALWCAAKA